MIPASGAPNPAEIAAATPLPIIMSCGILGMKLCLLINEDTATYESKLIDISSDNLTRSGNFKAPFLGEILHILP